MSVNPYASPQSLPQRAQEQSCLYSPNQIAGATFFGSIVAGSILLALNYQRLGKSTAAMIAPMVGLSVLLLVIAITSQLPDGFPATPLAVGQALGMLGLAKTLQGKDYADHKAKGGRDGSILRLLGISFGCLAIIFATLMIVM